jgi:non-heme chloroperoxidase
MTAHRAFSPAHSVRTSSIVSADGTAIATYEWGNESHPPIIFIHGIYQSALNWHNQFSAPELTGSYRVVAFDLRGHGASGKPDGPNFYRDPRRWAEDINALINKLSLDRPILVGWSYGGRVIGDYLKTHDDNALGGIVFVGARLGAGIPDEKSRPARIEEASHNAKSDDPILFMKGTRQFARLCFERAPARAEFEALAMNSMQTPQYVRRHLVGRPLDYDQALVGIRVPTLIIHGRKDTIVSLPVSQFTAASIPNATLKIFDDSGHSPFAEEPERFNDLIMRFTEGLRVESR